MRQQQKNQRQEERVSLKKVWGIFKNLLQFFKRKISKVFIKK
jgi:hypothetical protein